MAYRKFSAPKPRAIAARPTYTPSPYQQQILDFLLDGSGNAVVDAAPGSGKTSTIVLSTFALPTTSSVIVLSFNKDISLDVADKIPAHAISSTFHALGNRAVQPTLQARTRMRYVPADRNKVPNLYDALYPNQNNPLHGKVRATVLKLVEMAKMAVLLPAHISSEWVADTADHFDLDTSDADVRTLADMTRNLLTASNEQLTVIDFNDQLYLPLIFGCRFQTYDYIFVDESQDTNNARRQIIRQVMHAHSRVVAVGDKAQAIYGFTGADSDSLDLIAADFECTRLPLSISYRCPRLIVEHAQQYGHIEPSPTAKEGTILYPSEWHLTSFLPTDLVVCRNTAPLVSLAYKMLGARVPVRIKGRDIGQGLISLIKKLAGTRGTLDTLPTRLEEYRSREATKLEQAKRDAALQALHDKCDSVMLMLESLTPDDYDGGIPRLMQIITDLFSDEARGITTLSTIHKAKGLEASRVLFLDSHLCPSKYARQAWQKQQETNLLFVAVTRSLDTLVYLDSETIVP